MKEKVQEKGLFVINYLSLCVRDNLNTPSGKTHNKLEQDHIDFL